MVVKTAEISEYAVVYFQYFLLLCDDHKQSGYIYAFGAIKIGFSVIGIRPMHSLYKMTEFNDKRL